jgi:hypothetical protein
LQKTGHLYFALTVDAIRQGPCSAYTQGLIDILQRRAFTKGLRGGGMVAGSQDGDVGGWQPAAHVGGEPVTEGYGVVLAPLEIAQRWVPGDTQDNPIVIRIPRRHRRLHAISNDVHRLLHRAQLSLESNDGSPLIFPRGVISERARGPHYPRRLAHDAGAPVREGVLATSVECRAGTVLASAAAPAVSALRRLHNRFAGWFALSSRWNDLDVAFCFLRMGKMQQRSTATQDPHGAQSLDPLILAASKEVDDTLLAWALSLSPRERLRACSSATAALGRFANVPPPAR